MPGNDDYIEFMERQFPQDYLEESQSSHSSTHSNSKTAKIVVISLMVIIALGLIIFIIKEVVMIAVGLVAIGLLLALFFGAAK